MAADSKLIQEQKEIHEGLIQYNISYADVSQFSCWTCMLESEFHLIKHFSRKNGSLSTFVIVYEWLMKAAHGRAWNQVPLSVRHRRSILY